MASSLLRRGVAVLARGITGGSAANRHQFLLDGRRTLTSACVANSQLLRGIGGGVSPHYHQFLNGRTFSSASVGSDANPELGGSKLPPRPESNPDPAAKHQIPNSASLLDIEMILDPRFKTILKMVIVVNVVSTSVSLWNAVETFGSSPPEFAAFIAFFVVSSLLSGVVWYRLFYMSLVMLWILSTLLSYALSHWYRLLLWIKNQKATSG